MNFFGVLTLFGGLAVFLYGMTIMSNGLFQLGGSKVEKIIERLTKSTFKAILFGAGVTALIQSSSATTVMVVGFVNAGFMKLSQAIGVIAGANIGTTITAWILSLMGIQSSSFFVHLLKPTSFSPIIALVGIIIYLSAKDAKRKSIAESLIGFALLMMGMETMSTTMKPLASDPSFVNLMVIFDNPILSLLVGVIMTAVIQSSSASVGILQALSITGLLSVNATVPIILGQNIGTCITALLAVIGANRNAKRAAFSHLYFNIIGALFFVILYYTISSIFNIPAIYTKANPFSIAVIHSIFNVTTTVILSPFFSLLEKLSYFTIPKTEEEKLPNKFAILDDRFLSTPSFALDQCFDLIAIMADKNIESLDLANSLNTEYSDETANRIKEIEKEIDIYEDKLKKYVTKISQEPLTTTTTQRMSAYIQCINDFERISDHILLIQQNYEEISKSKESLSTKAGKELSVMSEATMDILRTTVNVFKTNDQELALTVEPLDSIINDLHRTAVKRHTKRMRKLTCTPNLGIFFSDITTSYVRIAAYCSNIAISFIHDNSEQVSEHAFQDYLEEFDQNFKILKEKYEQKYKI